MSDPNMHYDGQRWLRWDGSQWLDAESGQPVAGAPTPTGPKISGAKIAWTAGGLVVAFIFLIGIVAVAGGSGTPTAQPSTSPSATATPPPVAPTVKPTTAAPTPPPAPEPAQASTIEEGDWTVGVDVPPGKYKTAEKVSGLCYWGIYKAGTNKATIIDNGIAQGGYPVVTLKKGQEFTNQGCGTFVKQ